MFFCAGSSFKVQKEAMHSLRGAALQFTLYVSDLAIIKLQTIQQEKESIQ
jgi:hypothetical protein